MTKKLIELPLVSRPENLIIPGRLTFREMFFATIVKYQLHRKNAGDDNKRKKIANNQGWGLHKNSIDHPESDT